MEVSLINLKRLKKLLKRPVKWLICVPQGLGEEGVVE